jgi:transposase
MDVVFARCAGIAVQKRSVVACRLTRDVDGQPLAQTQTFGTTTGELLRLSDWLVEGGCSHVGRESTGEYWKPIDNLLEGTRTVWLLNAQHIKAVPGQCRDARPLCKRPNGALNCCATGWGAPALSRPSRSGNDAL